MELDELGFGKNNNGEAINKLTEKVPFEIE